jgi:hypothetical protein
MFDMKQLENEIDSGDAHNKALPAHTLPADYLPVRSFSYLDAKGDVEEEEDERERNKRVRAIDLESIGRAPTIGMNMSILDDRIERDRNPADRLGNTMDDHVAEAAEAMAAEEARYQRDRNLNKATSDADAAAADGDDSNDNDGLGGDESAGEAGDVQAEEVEVDLDTEKGSGSPMHDDDGEGGGKRGKRVRTKAAKGKSSGTSTGKPSPSATPSQSQSPLSNAELAWIELQPTSFLVKTGQRIRVAVFGADVGHFKPATYFPYDLHLSLLGEEASAALSTEPSTSFPANRKQPFALSFSRLSLPIVNHEDVKNDHNETETHFESNWREVAERK